VELANGDGDISTTTVCENDVKFFCRNIKPGEGRLVACLTNQLNEEDKGSVLGRKVSEPCKGEVRDFKIDRAENINKDVKLAVACKSDVEKFCNDSNIYPEPGAVLTCLREVQDKLTPMCSAEVLRTEVEAAKDFKVDAMLSELCSADAELLCKDVPPGEGAVQYCLRSKRAQLSWDCQEELFRQEVENADDVRLSVVLLRVCMKDKKTFCNDVKPGNARVKDCLEEKKDEPEFSEECKAEFEKMMERRATDFRLDVKLRELCKDDIEEVCGYEKDSLDSIAGYDGRVIECLQDYKDELVTPGCKKRVHRLTMRAAADIRMDRPLADACYEDRQRLCANVQPGDARVLRCLQDSREQLSYECRATLFDQEVRLSEDIDFQYPMKKACTSEISKFCDGVEHGQARVIGCLVEHDEEAEMSNECRAEVKRYEERAGEDYRLNYRLNKACDMEIDKLCADVCSPFQGQACGGTVLACLTQNSEKITDQQCKAEVFSTERTMGNDVRADAVLKDACEEDVKTYCADIAPGAGRVHECLREHKEEVSPECAAQELKLQIIQSSDIRLRPGMMRDCSEEAAVYCKKVVPGKSRMYNCLTNNIGKVDFSQQCKKRLEERTQRVQSFFKLDYGVRAACGSDVEQHCAAEKAMAIGKAAVLKCLLTNHAQLSSDACKTEVSRSARTALWTYHKGSPLTSVCDVDADTSCPDAEPSQVGSVGRCLAQLMSEHKPLSSACSHLINVAAPADPKQMFDDEMTTAAVLHKVEEIESAAGLSAGMVAAHASGAVGAPASGDSSMITLTGWAALASVAALVVVIAAAGVYAYKKYTGADKPYTLVVKGGDV